MHTPISVGFPSTSSPGIISVASSPRVFEQTEDLAGTGKQRKSGLGALTSRHYIGSLWQRLSTDGTTNQIVPQVPTRIFLDP